MAFWTLLWLALSLLFSTSYATYVRLVSPPSRAAENDLSTKRNAELPCPTMPSDSDVYTSLSSGKPYEFRWLNPDAIQGDVRAELLNSNLQLLTALNSIHNNTYDLIEKISSAKFQIPESECQNCILRLVQSSADQSYQMISCANIKIVKGVEEVCVGDECLVECWKNEECGNGVCFNGACYCGQGNYGVNCKNESQITSDMISDIDYRSYKNFSAGSSELLWNIKQNNIEIIMKFPLNTWIVFGVKPNHGSNDKCNLIRQQSIVNIENISVKPAVTKGPESTPLVSKESTSQQGPIGICGENEQFSHCPELNRECEPSCDWTAFPESIPTCPRACGTPRCVCKEGYVRSGNSKDECVPFNFCQEEVKVECSHNETWAKCGNACEPSCETMYDTHICKESCQESSCTCQDNYVRYQGSCIFWGDCPNLEEKFLAPSETTMMRASMATSKVTEKVTTTPPTTTTSIVEEPQGIKTINDTELLHCGINETINECGKVCEADCVSIFVRDECKECGTPACSCIQGYARNNGTCVYWGDCPLDGNTPPSKLENLVNEKDFKQQTPKEDFIKDTQPQTIEVSDVKNPSSQNSNVIGDFCYGEYRFPANCKNCDYKITWNFIEESDEIEFSLGTKLKQNYWTGVGFSKLGGMGDADLIVVKSFNNTITVHDMYSNSYDEPTEDFDQNIMTQKVIGSHVDGVLRVQFNRKRDTGDARMDHKFTDSKCYKFLFPVTGGPLDFNGHMRKHGVTPMVTHQYICIKSCRGMPSDEAKLADGECVNSFRYPENCKKGDCEYIAEWSYNDTKDEVHFEITSRGIGRWTGIGFSKDGNMANSDIYTGWVYGSKAFVLDRFAYGRQVPAIDPADRQNVYDIGGKIEDDFQTIWFKRKIHTDDQVTDYPLDQCYFFLYPVGGGRVLARKSQDFLNAKTPIGYHDLFMPKISATKICICNSLNERIASTKSNVRKAREAGPIDPFDDGQETPKLPMSIHPLKAAEEDPYACSDVIVAKVINGGYGRVVDAFALTKSNLEPDEFFSGKQSFSDIYATEVNGQAMVYIKRPLFSKDLVDYSLDNEQMQVFLANGPVDLSPVSLNHAANIHEISLNFYETITSPRPSSAMEISTVSTSPRMEVPIESTFDRMETEFTQPETRTMMSEETIPTMTDAMTEMSTTSEATTSSTRHALPTVDVDVPIIKDPTSIDSCYGYFNYPENCNTDCSYQVDWTRHENVIMFRLHAALYPEMWTGIGFSKDGAMVNSDAVIVSIYKDSTVAMTDQFASNYGRPKVDTNQDIFNVSTVYADGHVFANFSRSLNTNDHKDANLEECQYFIFIQSGGQLEGGTAEIRKHIETPIHSKTRICMSDCNKANTTLTSSTTTTTPTKPSTTPFIKTTPAKKVELKKPKENVLLGAGTLQIHPINVSHTTSYDVILRLLNKEFSVEFDDMESFKSKKLSKEIVEELTRWIQLKWQTLDSISVLKFAKGSVLTLVRAEFKSDGTKEIPKEEELEEYLKNLSKTHTDKLAIDSNNLKVHQSLRGSTDDKWAPLKDVKNWIIVGAALIILTFIVFLLLCCSLRRKNDRVHPDAFSFAPPMHKGYPSYGYPPNSGDYAIDPSPEQEPKKTPTVPKKNVENAPKEEKAEPHGIGNCTYQEWFTKVASKDTNSHLQENNYNAGHGRDQGRSISRISAQSNNQPFVSYPHDPIGYYTMNGEHRLPPPAYYRYN